MIKLTSLESNFQYKKLLKKKRINTDYFTIYFEKKLEKKQKNLNISFVMKKKVGNAVVRNKIKRRLKSAIQKNLNEKKTINCDCSYLVFGKTKTFREKFSNIKNSIDQTFSKISKIVN